MTAVSHLGKLTPDLTRQFIEAAAGSTRSDSTVDAGIVAALAHDDYQRAALPISVGERSPVRLARSSSGNVWAVMKPLVQGEQWSLLNVKSRHEVVLPIRSDQEIRGIRFFDKKAVIVSENADANNMAVHIVEPNSKGQDVVVELPSLSKDLDLVRVYETSKGSHTIGLFQNMSDPESPVQLLDLRTGKALLPPKHSPVTLEPTSTPDGDLLYAIQVDDAHGRTFKIYSVQNQSFLQLDNGRSTTGQGLQFSSMPVFSENGELFAGLAKGSSKGVAAYYDLRTREIHELPGYTSLAVGPTRLKDGSIAVVARTKEGQLHRVKLPNGEAFGPELHAADLGKEINRIWMSSSGNVIALIGQRGRGQLVSSDRKGRFQKIFTAKQMESAFEFSHDHRVPDCVVVKVVSDLGDQEPLTVTYIVNENTAQISKSFPKNRVRHFLQEIAPGENVLALRCLGRDIGSGSSSDGFELFRLTENSSEQICKDPEYGRILGVHAPVQNPRTGNWHALARTEKLGYTVLNLTKGTFGAPIYLELIGASELQGLTFTSRGEPLVIGKNPIGNELLVLAGNTVGDQLGHQYSTSRGANWMDPPPKFLDAAEAFFHATEEAAKA